MPRIYVSSRWRTLDSPSTSDFTFPLKSGALEFQEHQTCIIDSLAISNVFETVIAGHNQKIYARYKDNTVGAFGTRTDIVLTLTPGDKTLTSLAAELQTLLQGQNPGTHAFLNTTIVCLNVGNDLTVQVQALTNGSLELLTRHALRHGGPLEYTYPWTGTGANALDLDDPQDGCAVCGLGTGHFVCTNAAVATGNHVNFQPYTQLYLHSNLDTESVGPRGESNIALSVVVANTVAGDIITLSEGYEASPIKLPQALSLLKFSLRDSAGRVVDLHGHDMSFALLTQ